MNLKKWLRTYNVITGGLQQGRSSPVSDELLVPPCGRTSPVEEGIVNGPDLSNMGVELFEGPALPPATTLCRKAIRSGGRGEEILLYFHLLLLTSSYAVPLGTK